MRFEGKRRALCSIEHNSYGTSNRDRPGLRYIGGISLVSIGGHLRRRFAHLDLRAHLLNGCSESRNLLLLLRDSRLEFGDGALLLYELGLLFRDLAVFF